MKRTLWTAVTLSLSALLLPPTPATAQLTVSALTPVVSTLIGQNNEAEALFSEGRLAYDKKDYEKAIEKFTAAIKKDDTEAVYYFERGQAYFFLGRNEEALKDFDKLIELKPRMADAYRVRGRAYVRLGNADKAIADFDAAFEKHPRKTRYVPLYQDRAQAYVLKEDYEKAIGDYNMFFQLLDEGRKAKRADREALAAEPIVYNNRSRALLGKYQTEKKDNKASKADLDQALEDVQNAITKTESKRGKDGTTADTTPLLLTRGDTYLLREEYDKAVADYSSFLDKNPDNVEALTFRALAYENWAKQNGQKDAAKIAQAKKDFDTVLKLDANNESAKTGIIRLALDTGTPDEVLAILSKSIANPPKKEQAADLGRRAIIYLEKKDWANAVKDYDALLKFEPQNKTAFYNRAVANSNLNAYDKAVADYDAFLALKPEKPEDKINALSGKAQALASLKQDDKAVEAYTQLIAVAPDKVEPATYFNRATAYFNLSKNTDKTYLEKASNDLDSYLKVKADDAKAKKLKSDIEFLILAGASPEEQIKGYEAKIATEPNNGDLRTKLAAIYFNQKNFDKAIEQLSKAVEINPKDDAALTSRASAYAQKGDWANVAKDATAALAVKPDRADALQLRAAANLNDKKYTEAIADYEKILAAEPENSDAIKGLASAYVANKDYANTVRIMDKYIKKFPTDLEAVYSRGTANIGLMKYNDGITDLTKYIEGGGKEKGLALYNRGFAQLKMNATDKALADFEAALVAKKDYNTAVEAAKIYALEGDKIRDAQPLVAAEKYAKSATLYGIAVEALDLPDSKETEKDKKKADALLSQATVLSSQGYAAENVEIVKTAVTAFEKYLAVAKPLNLPEVAGAEEKMKKAKKYIEENG